MQFLAVIFVIAIVTGAMAGPKPSLSRHKRYGDHDDSTTACTESYNVPAGSQQGDDLHCHCSNGDELFWDCTHAEHEDGNICGWMSGVSHLIYDPCTAQQSDSKVQKGLSVDLCGG